MPLPRLVRSLALPWWEEPLSSHFNMIYGNVRLWDIGIGSLLQKVQHILCVFSITFKCLGTNMTKIDFDDVDCILTKHLWDFPTYNNCHIDFMNEFREERQLADPSSWDASGGKSITIIHVLLAEAQNRTVHDEDWARDWSCRRKLLVRHDKVIDEVWESDWGGLSKCLIMAWVPLSNVLVHISIITTKKLVFPLPLTDPSELKLAYDKVSRTITNFRDINSDRISWKILKNCFNNHQDISSFSIAFNWP